MELCGAVFGVKLVDVLLFLLFKCRIVGSAPNIEKVFYLKKSTQKSPSNEKRASVSIDLSNQKLLNRFSFFKSINRHFAE